MNLTLRAIDFGPTFTGYQPAESTAPLRIADLEGEPCTTNEVAALKRLDFQVGYNRDWVRPAGAPSESSLSVGSYVEVYPDADAARARIAFDRTNVVAPLPAGCDVQQRSSSTFEVNPVPGDEAFGYRRIIVDAGGTTLTYTWTEFRRGRIVATADVIRDDSRDTAAETAGYAKVLDARIVKLLSAPD